MAGGSYHMLFDHTNAKDAFDQVQTVCQGFPTLPQ